MVLVVFWGLFSVLFYLLFLIRGFDWTHEVPSHVNSMNQLLYKIYLIDSCCTKVTANALWKILNPPLFAYFVFL